LKLVDEKNQYSFEVARKAGKKDVKRVVESRFKVTIEKVRVVNVRGKVVMWGRKRIRGRRKDWKKAIVTLKSSDSIDLFKVK